MSSRPELHPPAAQGALAHHFETLEQQAEAGALGMWAFLIQEVMFFAHCHTTLFALTFAARRAARRRDKRRAKSVALRRGGSWQLHERTQNIATCNTTSPAAYVATSLPVTPSPC